MLSFEILKSTPNFFDISLSVISSKVKVCSSFNILYIMFIVLAAFCYAINANVLKYKLSNIPALGIVFMSFLFMFIPAFIILCF